MKKYFLLIIALFLAFYSPDLSEANNLQENMQLSINPETISINLGFKGGEAEITGSIPPGSEVYLKLQSAPGTVPLNQKDKKGPLWITVEHVQVEGVPKICQVLSSNSIAGLSPDLSETMEIDNQFYFIKRKGRVTKKEEGKKEVLPPDSSSQYLDGLINIYKKRNLYAIRENALEVTGNSFHVNIAIPPEIPPGDTIITAYAVKEGKIIGKAQCNLFVKNTGIAGWARNQAITNGPMYGIIAVIIALIGGLGIGTAFNWLDKIFSRNKHKGAASDVH
jgi:hypothetical protein